MCTKPNVYVGLINFLAKNFECVVSSRENPHFGVSALNFISNMWCCWCHKAKLSSLLLDVLPAFSLEGSIKTSLSVERIHDPTQVHQMMPSSAEAMPPSSPPAIATIELSLLLIWGLIELKNLLNFNWMKIEAGSWRTKSNEREERWVKLRRMTKRFMLVRRWWTKSWTLRTMRVTHMSASVER